VVSFALMITVGVALRSDPQLRGALISAAMDAVGTATGVQGSTKGQTLALGQSTPRQPQDTIRVNRPGFGHVPSARFNQAAPQQELDTQITAAQIGKLLESLSQQP
jgi:hypothetical protein